SAQEIHMLNVNCIQLPREREAGEGRVSTQGHGPHVYWVQVQTPWRPGVWQGWSPSLGSKNRGKNFSPLSSNALEHIVHPSV
ncbi:unnamed protein product, partial [Nesidiocoris tenuis]